MLEGIQTLAVDASLANSSGVIFSQRLSDIDSALLQVSSAFEPPNFGIRIEIFCPFDYGLGFLSSYPGHAAFYLY